MASTLAENITAVLVKASPDNLPAVESTDAALVLTYEASTFGARCSADDAALRALKGLKLGAATQVDGSRPDGTMLVTVSYAVSK